MTNERLTVPKPLRRSDWQWSSKGLSVLVDGQRVFFPAKKVIEIFDQSLSENGIPPEYSVGSASSVGGFFKKLRRGIKKAARKARNKVRKITRSKLVRGIARGVKKVGRIAKKVVTHPAFRAGFAAVATAFPVLAPAAAGLEVASRVVKKIEDGKKAAGQILKGAKGAQRALAGRKVQEARKAQRMQRRITERAKRGDRAAQRALGGILGARVASRAAKRADLRARGVAVPQGRPVRRRRPRNLRTLPKHLRRYGVGAVQIR